MSHPSNPLSETALDALIAKERTRVVAPLTEWRALSERLRSEGVIRAEQASAYDAAPSLESFGGLPRTRQRAFVRWGTRFVVSAMLLGMGIVIGRGMTIGNQVVPIVKQAIQEASADSVFQSTEQATRVLVHSQSQYQRAAAYLAARDSSPHIIGGPEMYQERLAALDEMLATTREKLRTAPADPVLNQYYESAAGAREATIQQLGQTLPAGVKIGHY